MSASDGVSIVTCRHCGRRNRLQAVASGVPHCSVCGKPLPWLVETSQEIFDAAVEQSPVPVLVDFWAPWCGPCRIVEPVVERISREQAGRLKVAKVNSDLAPELSQRFEVRGIPTLMIFDRGQVVDRITGAPAPGQLQSWVESKLASR